MPPPSPPPPQNSSSWTRPWRPHLSFSRRRRPSSSFSFRVEVAEALRRPLPKRKNWRRCVVCAAVLAAVVVDRARRRRGRRAASMPRRVCFELALALLSVLNSHRYRVSSRRASSAAFTARTHSVNRVRRTASTARGQKAGQQKWHAPRPHRGGQTAIVRLWPSRWRARRRRQWPAPTKLAPCKDTSGKNRRLPRKTCICKERRRAQLPGLLRFFARSVNSLAPRA